MNPELIGRYQIISEIGRGGMAVVYHAYDPSFEREVAIKVLPHAFLHDAQFRARFDREAKTIAALEHPAIVPVYDFGEQDGQPFIVMRLMNGGSLADKLKHGPLSIKEATDIITRIAPALDAAHRKGIIHRDLKPGNILFDQYENAFISDFGIARLTEAGATLTGSIILGTPTYMSPEQVQGDEEIGDRSDIYSLGIIFYQMITGDPPYQATTPAKVMMMHILEPVPDLSDSKINITPEIKAVIETALAKEPEARFASVQAIADALQAALQDSSRPSRVSLSKIKSSKSQEETLLVPRTAPPQQAEPSRIAAAPAIKSKSRWLPITLVVIGLVAIGMITLFSLIYFGIKGTGPLALLAASTNTPTPSRVVTNTTAPPQAKEGAGSDITDTALPTTEPAPSTHTPTPQESTPTTPDKPPSQTIEPSPSETVMVSALPVIGGADKIAFLNENDLWLVNVDGSDLQQLTNDGTNKSDISWSADGLSLTYISGKCVQSVDIESDQQAQIACFETGDLTAFETSPDGDQIAISLNKELFVIPYDPDGLSQVRSRRDLQDLSDCPALAPLQTSTGASVIVKLIRWSADAQKLALLVLGNDQGRQVDLIRILDISTCDFPDIVHEFPTSWFTIEDYDKYPYLQNFGFNGDILFVLNSYTRNDGYGHLYVYNIDTFTSEDKINPIGGNCCYRDAQFSPDGRYLIFVHQPFEAGAHATIYYIPYGSVGSGMQHQPIPLPDDFFLDPKAKPQPVLRPAK
jgi:serine/threonine protein kinase